MFARLIIAVAVIMLGPDKALAQERLWTLDQTDNEVYLIFGVPETDDVGVSFWCTLHSGIVRLYMPDAGPGIKAGTRVNFELKVAAKIYPLKGAAAINEETTGTSLEAELKTTDPVFSDLQAANYFAVKAGSSNHSFPLGEADFATFLAVCGTP